MQESFTAFCESLWRDWLAGTLETSPFVKAAFDLDAAPEPYISFSAGTRPLVALTTNPGATMPHQRRAAVRIDGGPLSTSAKYATAAKALGDFYEQRLTGPARRRIARLRSLSALMGTDGVVQVEVCPFHSPSLPKKDGLLRAIREDGLLTRYVDHVQRFLRDQMVLVVSAAPSRVSLGPGMSLSAWVTWQAKLAGLDLERAEFVPLVRKGAKTTCGAFVSSDNGAPKGLVLMMGGNHLPGEERLGILAEALRRSTGHAG